ncbi:hypothetical protein B5F76_08885 [Desulfovibrio sp. An276]|uniref:VCBS domain-containing protein n=1 Tax=Desulfovibrio sp. An276 TaxID=1965618 RepID=UPI000B38EA9E|nr:VCBS domain-containing protein [Desulfovibrio sp. An276]OUO51771.1 hypothetical protein B5F76_08885 [Desulfovibrio sp. An276]
MADIRLVKPQANAVHNVPCATGNRFVLEFPSDAALFAKDGDDLVLSFEDGSSIRLQDFYTTYSKEEMPSFEMEGAEISGEDFFAALGNPDLMPAAGPSAAAATRGGGFNQYGNVELLQGIDRLGGLDISFNWGQEHEDDLYAYGHRDIDYGVSVVPVVPGILDPDIPVVDDPDNPNDGGVGPVVDRLEVWEEGLANGSNPAGKDVPTVAHGGMDISAPDGVATIVIGTVTVFANGHLVRGSDGAPVKVDTGEGYLQVTGFNPATGRLEYAYTLRESTQEHDQGKANEHFTHLLPVTVTDSDGDRGSSTISVVIRDDEPTAYDDANAMKEGANETYQCSGNVITGMCDEEEIVGSADIQGADGASLTAVVSVGNSSASAENVDGALEIRGEYGTLTIWPDGSYTYDVDRENYNKQIMGLKDGESLKDVFAYTLTDRDGDQSGAYLTISINGTSHSIPEFSGKVTVDEADLTDDSNKGHEGNAPGIEGIGTATPGSFTLEVMDGLVSMTINGEKVDLILNDNGTVTLTPGQQFSDDNGYLTIDSIAGVGEYKVTYTYHLTNSTLHPAGADRNHLANLHSFEVTVSDQDGSSKCGLINVDIIDDIPELEREPDFIGDAAQVREEALQDSGTGLATATVNLAAAFANLLEHYGADGPNQADAAREKGVYTLELSAERVATNLEGLVGDGEGPDAYAQIFLVKTEDGDVQGVAGDNDTPCFTISIDEDGKATFTLQQPVQHGAEGTKTDDILTLETVNDGSFTIKYTITDADGDTANKSLDLGQAGVFTIEDSETKVLANQDQHSANTSLTVDESFANRNDDRFAQGDQEEPDNIGTAVLDKEYVQGLFEIQTGADDKGLTGMEVAHKFSLIFSGDANSGLTGLYEDKNGVTQSGSIFLYKNEEDGSISGRVGGKDGPEAFKLEIDDQTGEITLTMTDAASIRHDKTDRFDETATLAGKIQVELSVTDRDGDKDSATANVTLNFQDDGPALSLPSAKEMTSKAQVADDGTITGHLSGEMQFDFGADGPAQSGAVTVEIRYGEGDLITITCTYNAETGSWSGETEDGHAFTIKPKGDPSLDDLYTFEYTRPVSVSETSDGDVTIKVTVTDGDGDSIFQQTTDYAPTITVEDNDDAAVKEAGVAGHEEVQGDPDNPNAEVSGKPSVSGQITLAQSSGEDKADDDDLALILYGGSIEHTTLTLDDPNDPADQKEGEQITSEVGNFGKIDEEKGGSFYLVQNGEKLALKESVSEGEDYYGTLTFTKGEEDTWTWEFTLNDGNSDLVNSMTEREEIHLSLKLGVSDGMLQDGSGKLDITIHGTNDLPYFVVGENWADKAGDAVLTATDSAASQEGWKTEWEGTLQAEDPDKDNGEGSQEQGVNHLKFSLTSEFSTDAGQVTEEVPNPYQPYQDSNDEKNNLLSSIQKDLTNGTDTEKDLNYTEIATIYGTFRVYENGEYTYTPSDTSKIGADEYVTETFTVRVEDAHGSFTTETITITLRDNNYATAGGKKVTLVAREEGVLGDSVKQATAEGYNTHVPTENGETEGEGSSVLFRDDDVNDTLTLTAENSTLSWKEGEEQKTESINFPEDGIIVSIAGGPATSLSLVAIPGEDGNWSFAWQARPAQNADVVGTLTLTRTENGEVTSSFELDPKNKDPFNEDNNNDIDNSRFLDQLSQGETVTVKLPLTATSSGGGKEAQSSLTITIKGTNDRPVIESVMVQDEDGSFDESTGQNSTLRVDSADENSASGSESVETEPDLTGKVLAHDVDEDNGGGSNEYTEHQLIFTLSNMESRVQGQGVEGSIIESNGSTFFNHEDDNPGDFTNQYTTIKTTYGKLELNPDGTFDYYMDEPKLVENEDGTKTPNAIMALGLGHSVTETYTVRVTDSHGSWTEKTFEITIQGTNEKPVITSKELEVHGVERNTADSSYHDEDGKGYSVAWVTGKDYDIGDSVTRYCFLDKGSEDAQPTDSIEIKAIALLNLLLQEGGEKYFTADPEALAVLKTYLTDYSDEVVATLKLQTVTGENGATEGKLTLVPNQNSYFIQSLKTSDSVSFDLSDICSSLIVAQDKNNAYSEGVDVKLVLHGTNDATNPSTVDVPHVKEEGFYRDEEESIQGTTQKVNSDDDDNLHKGEHLNSDTGSFTINDRDAGQVIFKLEGQEIGKETNIQYGEDNKNIDFETDSNEPMYVLGKYGYYEITLGSTMDPSTGSKTFEYSYHLFNGDADTLPQKVQELLQEKREDFQDKLNAIDSIPQGEQVPDNVTIQINTGKGDKDLILSATVSGSNDKPYINDVVAVEDANLDTGYEALEVVTSKPEQENPGEQNCMYFDKAKGELHITLQSNSDGSTGKYIGKIAGLDRDSDQYEGAQGTHVVSYSFVYTGEDGLTQAANMWTINGNTATSSFGTISIDAEGVIRIELDKDAGKNISAGEIKNIFAGLSVICKDDLGAHSDRVNLVGMLVGVDDEATAIDSTEYIWEGQHVHDKNMSQLDTDFSDVWADREDSVLHGFVKVTDPDLQDTISVTVDMGSGSGVEEFVLSFTDGKSQEIPGKYGTFIFTWKQDKDSNTVTLDYEYKYTTGENQLEHLNVGETMELENVQLSFTSKAPNGGTHTVPSSIDIIAKGTNDAPEITVTDSCQDGPDQDGVYTHKGTVPNWGQVEGELELSDVDNSSEELYCGFLSYTKDGTTYYVYGETGKDGITVYKQWYPNPEAEGSQNLDTLHLTLDQLTPTQSVQLDHGTLYVDDNGHYKYSRNPEDIVTSDDNSDIFYVTVRDEHGAMDSVAIKFECEGAQSGGPLPAVDMQNPIEMPVTEPGPDGGLVHVGDEEGTVGLYDEGIYNGLSLTVYYTKDDSGSINLLHWNKDGILVDANEEGVQESELSQATATLEQQDDGSFEWVYKDQEDVTIQGFPEVDLEIRFGESWETGTYSLETEYGTVYWDKATGEVRYELDSRADALNAGQVVTENVSIWINGKKMSEMLQLEITGTGDASEVDAPALTVELGSEDNEEQGTLHIEDIDNADGAGDVYDTHSLQVKLGDSKTIDVDDGKTIYVLADGNGYKLVSKEAFNEEDGDVCYGELTFHVNGDNFSYTFTAHEDSKVSKDLKDGQSVDFTVPIVVTDKSSVEGATEADHNDQTTTESAINITLVGKADEPEITGTFDVGITEEGVIPEGEEGTQGPGSHAVSGSLNIEAYNESYTVKGVFLKEGQTDEKADYTNASTFIQGTYGTLVLRQDGFYTYTLEYDKVQHLREGQEVEENFAVQVTSQGGTVTETITVTIHGQNDLPEVIVTRPVLSVLEKYTPEDSGEPDISATGKVNAQDIDTGDELTYGIQVGEDFIAVSEEESQVTVYVTGTKSADGKLTFELAQQDPDDDNYVGKITMSSDGNYTFTLNQGSDLVRELNTGESKSFEVQVGVNDGTDTVTKPVQITINGSNEAPEITADIKIFEDDMVVSDSQEGSYTLTITPGEEDGYGYQVTDAEGENLTYTFELPRGEQLQSYTTRLSLGDDGEKYEVTFVIDKESGEITLTYGDDLRNAIDALAQDASAVLKPEDLLVVVQDESGAKASSDLTLTVTGTNDAPVINTALSNVTDNKGSVVFTDVDTSDTHTITFNGLLDASGNALTFNTEELPQSLAVYDEEHKQIGTLEGITLAQKDAQDTLTYTFRPDNTYLNTLPVGESKEISFSVTVDDNHGEPQDIDQSFSIVNNNDSPEIEDDKSTSIEDSEGITGTLVFSDDDITDTHTVVFDGLRNGNGDNITIDLADFSQQQAVQSVYLEGELVGKLTVSYAKGEDNQNNKITYTFEAAEKLNHLQVGDTDLPFTVSIKDAGGLKTEEFKDGLTLVNKNDDPIITVTPGQGDNTGTIEIEDADKLDRHTIFVLYDGTSYPLAEGATEVSIPDLGVIVFEKTESGWSYSFEANASVQNKYPAGTTTPESVSIQANDGHTTVTSDDFSVIIKGTNTIPDISYGENITIASLESYALSLPATDDDGDTLEYTFAQTNGQYGTLVFDEDSGQYTYEINPEAFAGISDRDEPLTESFDYTVDDGVNAPVQGTITLNLDLSNLELPLPVEPEETPGEEETTIPDSSQGDSSETADTDADEDFEAIVYSIENGDDDTPLFTRDTYSLADGEEMYSLSPDEPEENTVDIVAYDSTDYMVDGGEGVSFMVSENEDLTMDDILQGDGQHGPIVSNIDVLITGEGAESLTNMDQLARDYGISVDRDANALTLDESWQKVDSGHTDTQVFSNGSLTLETSLDVSLPSDDLNVQAAMNQVNNN